MTVLVFPLLFLYSAVGIEGVSLVKKADSIIDVTIDCGANQAANSLVIKILTDVDISAVAKCKNGEKTFISTDSVHYTLPATLRARDNLCELMEKDGSNNFDIEVIVHYGEADSLILTKTKLVTVVCTYDSHGKDDSPQHTVRDGPQAPIAIQTFVGGTVPASDLTLSIQTVDDQDAVGTIAFDRRYSLFGTYTGSMSNVGLKPVSCDAISNHGERYAVLTAGCGDGFIFARTDGFVTTGTTFRSPYFFAFHLADSGNLAFDCNVTLCSGSCEGTSCETVCGTVKSSPITNGQLGTCTGNEKLGDSCSFICDRGYDPTGDGISTCGADGIWTVPSITCTRCTTQRNLPDVFTNVRQYLLRNGESTEEGCRNRCTGTCSAHVFHRGVGRCYHFIAPIVKATIQTKLYTSCFDACDEEPACITVLNAYVSTYMGICLLFNVPARSLQLLTNKRFPPNYYGEKRCLTNCKFDVSAPNNFLDIDSIKISRSSQLSEEACDDTCTDDCRFAAFHSSGECTLFNFTYMLAFEQEGDFQFCIDDCDSDEYCITVSNYYFEGSKGYCLLFNMPVKSFAVETTSTEVPHYYAEKICN